MRHKLAILAALAFVVQILAYGLWLPPLQSWRNVTLVCPICNGSGRCFPCGGSGRMELYYSIDKRDGHDDYRRIEQEAKESMLKWESLSSYRKPG